MPVKKFFKYIYELLGKRVITVYLLIYFVSLYFIDYDSIIYKFKIQTLNRIRPLNFNYLVDTWEEHRPFDPAKLKDYIYYYTQVTKAVEGRADAYGLLGFCYYKIGETQKSIEAYQESIRINPEFYWAYHNLAVIYFKAQQYEKASEIITKGLRLDVEKTMLSIYNSPQIYLPLVVRGVQKHKIDEPEQFVLDQLEDGFRDGYLMWVLGYFYLNDYPSTLRAADITLNASLEKKLVFNYYAGLAAYELKQYALALKFFEASIREDDTFADAYHYLGECAKAMGQEKIAAVAQIRAELLKSKPGYFDVKKLEEGLELKLY